MEGERSHEAVQALLDPFQGGLAPAPTPAGGRGHSRMRGPGQQSPGEGQLVTLWYPHTKRCALSNRPLGSCAQARVCQEGRVCGRPHSHPLSRPASHPPCTSSSRIRNSSSSFWSFPSWTSCFNRASSVSMCLIYKIEDGRDTGGHVGSTPWLSRQRPAVSGTGSSLSAWPERSLQHGSVWVPL